MSKDMIFTLIAAVFYIAIIYVLVRPNSNGPKIVTAISDTLSDLVKGTVGYTYDSSTSTWSAP